MLQAILVSDDSHQFRGGIVAAIKADARFAKYEIIETSDLEETLELVMRSIKGRIGFVLTDFSMGHLRNEGEIVVEISTNPEFNIPTAIMSLNPEDITEATKAKCVFVYDKNDDIAPLLDKIHEALGQDCT